MSRLATGGLVDRGQPLDFTFDGCAMQGLAGDTLASALVANGVRLVARSFKYHRPRGILTAGPEEPNALVTLGRGADSEPNCRAPAIELFAGLEAHSQNRWPSLRFDALAVNQLLSPIFVAGFYYKTFMWPSALWEKLYEPLIRRAAGLGALSMLPDPDAYDHDHAFCDLLVIGGGPAGLAAALQAGRAGLRVLLVEQDSRLGGRLLSERHEVDGKAGHQWAADVAAELAAMANVRILARTQLFGIYDHGQFGALERISDDPRAVAPGKPRQKLWKIVARRSVLATGALERPITFGGNDRPGVMMASAASTFLNRHAALAGQRLLVFTSCDSGWQLAQDLAVAGAPPVAVVDPRGAAGPGEASLRAAGVEIMCGAQLAGVSGAPVRSAQVRLADGTMRKLAVDGVAMGGGWNPAIGLASNLGHRPAWSEAKSCFLIDRAPAGLAVAGSADGCFSLTAALADGADKAMAICAELGAVAVPLSFTTSEDPASGAPFWYVRQPLGKAFVDFQNDVTDTDVGLAVREGFLSIEHLKRYTTLGMATDQGKNGQLNAHAILAGKLDKPMGEVGTILARPPWHPVPIGAFAGCHREEHFRPVRHPASHAWAQANGGDFTDAGQWKRARWYARAGETDWQQIVNREVAAVRNGVGLCDVSTLGKIDLQGPDALTLVERLYCNGLAKLPVGKARYGVMLREDGMVMDDGTVTRLGEDHFYITTTTANAARVMQHIDYARQVLWPDLDVQAVSVTEQWSAIAVAGPNSRALLERAFPEEDLGDTTLPFMGLRTFRWQGHAARLFRVSFSGELAYEVCVPADLGEALWLHLLEAGRDQGVTPYGTEALGVMRIEKGHVAGAELSGQTTAGDLGLGRMMSKAKDYVGRVMAQRPGLVDPERPALVGLKPVDRSRRLRSGAHLFAVGAQAVAANDQGYVTSSAYSPELGHSIALGLLARGPERYGEIVMLRDPLRGEAIEAEVCHPVFIDPEGGRLRG